MTSRCRIALLCAILMQWVVGSANAQTIPIKIGVLNDQSSVYADLAGAGSVVAAGLAVDDVGGVVLGREIQVLSANHTNKVDVASTVARRWFDVEGVSAVFDLYNSAVSLAVQAIAEEKSKIAVSTTAMSAAVTGRSCSPNGMVWGNDGYQVANLVVKGASGDKPSSWFFITVDYTAGHSVEQDARRFVEARGNAVVGSVKYPLGSPDFSSYLLRAQSSGAKIIGFVGGGSDFTTAAKQVREFAIQEGGQRFVPLLMTTADVGAVGQETAKGMPIVLSAYWDENDATRAWSERFKSRHGKLPTDPQAQVYSAVLHYLKAIKASGTTDTNAVLRAMKQTPVDDFFTKGAKVRADGRLMRDAIYAEVKAPTAMRHPNDILHLVRRYSADDVFMPASLSECKLLR